MYNSSLITTANDDIISQFLDLLYSINSDFSIECSHNIDKRSRLPPINYPGLKANFLVHFPFLPILFIINNIIFTFISNIRWFIEYDYLLIHLIQLAV